MVLKATLKSRKMIHPCLALQERHNSLSVYNCSLEPIEMGRQVHLPSMPCNELYADSQSKLFSIMLMKGQYCNSGLVVNT